MICLFNTFKRIKKLMADIADDVKTVLATVTALQATVAELQTQVAALQAPVAPAPTDLTPVLDAIADVKAQLVPTPTPVA